MSKGKKKSKKAMRDGQPRTLHIGDGCTKRSLTVEIAGTGETYEVPFADSLSIGDAMMVRKAAQAPKQQRDDAFFGVFYKIICKYVPKKYIDALSMDDFTTLVRAWNGGTAAGGASLGE